MTKSEDFEIIQTYIPKNEWSKIHKISIFYDEYILLKWISLINPGCSWHRKYFIRVTYKNKSKKIIAINIAQKNVIKPIITNFNFYLGNLTLSDRLAHN